MATTDNSTDTFAAIDLGSNSFHMVIARLVHNEVRILDRLRNQVQLAKGLDERNVLSDEDQQRALAALEVLGERIRHLPPSQVRAVGTNTLRRARNARDFMRQAQRALGHRIEVISGTEEARLIFLGVAHSSPVRAGRRLLVDIGGGSTECIIGERFEAMMTASLYMGCVSYSLKYFPGGHLTTQNMDRARTAARLELRTMKRQFRDLGWDHAKGSSGTIRAIEEIVRRNGWSESAEGVDAAGLKRLRKAVIKAGHVNKLNIRGLQSERQPVLPGGLAILSAVFDSLKVDFMRPSGGALREGVLYDLLGRIRQEDIRDRTIQRFVEHYQVDLSQSSRVERSVLYCLRQVEAAWDLSDSSYGRALAWAGRLHEIGLVLSYRGYHRHGAYLIGNSDMPGFSVDDQILLAALIRCHRRKVPDPLFVPEPAVGLEVTLRLCVLLRLAVLLNRGRGSRPLPTYQLRAAAHGLEVSFPPGWLAEHPLTIEDLDQEATFLNKVGFSLSFS